MTAGVEKKGSDSGMQRPEGPPPPQSIALNGRTFEKAEEKESDIWNAKTLNQVVYEIYDRILQGAPEEFCSRWEYRDAMAHLVTRVEAAIEGKGFVEPEEREYYGRLKERFKYAIEHIPEEKVAKLRETFVSAFNRPEAPFEGCNLDAAKERIEISYDQLKLVTKLLKKELAGCYYMAFGEKEQLLLNRLAGRIALKEAPPGHLRLKLHPFTLIREPICRGGTMVVDNSFLYRPSNSPSCRIDLSQAFLTSMQSIRAQFIHGLSRITIEKKGCIWPEGQEKTLCSFFLFLDDYCDKLFIEVKNRADFESELHSFISSATGVTFDGKKESIDRARRAMQKALLSRAALLPEPLVRQLKKCQEEDRSPPKELFKQAKLAEFLLLFSHENKSLLQKLRSQHINNKELRTEKGPPLSLKQIKGFDHTFSPSLRPLYSSITSELLMEPCEAERWGISVNFNKKVAIGTLSSRAEYQTDREALFALPPAETLFHFNSEALWNCRLPKKIHDSLGRAVPLLEQFHCNGVKAKLARFSEELESFSTYKFNQSHLYINPRVAVEKKEYVWSLFLNSMEKPPRKTPPANVEVAEWLTKFLIDGKENFERYALAKGKESESGIDKIGEEAEKLLKLCFSAKVALDDYLSDEKIKGIANDVDRRFSPIKSRLDSFIDLLREMIPKRGDALFSPDQTPMNIMYFAIFQSDDPEDINWKVIRYRSMLKQLCNKIEKISAGELALPVEIESGAYKYNALGKESSEGEKLLFQTLSNLVKKVQFDRKLESSIDGERQAAGNGADEAANSLKNLDELRDNYSKDFIEAIRMSITTLEKEAEEISAAFDRQLSDSLQLIGGELNKASGDEGELIRGIAAVAADINQSLQQKNAIDSELATNFFLLGCEERDPEYSEDLYTKIIKSAKNLLDYKKSKKKTKEDLNKNLTKLNEIITRTKEGGTPSLLKTAEKVAREITTIQKIYEREEQCDKLLDTAYQICEKLYTETDFEKESLALLEMTYMYGSKSLKNDFSKQRGKEDRDPEYILTKKIPELLYYQKRLPDNKTTSSFYRSCKSLNDMLVLWKTFDPNKQANLPQRLATLKVTKEDGSEKEIAALAFGTPTIESRQNLTVWRKETDINVEFSSFIKKYEKEGKKHLFIINQHMCEGENILKDVKHALGVDDEPGRVKEILNFARNHPNTLFPIVITRDSNFVNQTGEYRELSNSELFKKNLIQQHLNEDPKKSGIFIPPQVREKTPDLEAECTLWIELFHKVLFNKNEALTVTERQIFIDLFQNFLVTHLCLKLGVDSLNFTCKDAIDRGMAMFTMWIALQGILYGLATSTLFSIRIMLYLLSRAIATRKRVIIIDRAMRALQTMRFYEKNRERLVVCNSKIFGDSSIIPLNPDIPIAAKNFPK